jgi:hypothetical protein
MRIESTLERHNVRLRKGEGRTLALTTRFYTVYHKI